MTAPAGDGGNLCAVLVLFLVCALIGTLLAGEGDPPVTPGAVVVLFGLSIVAGVALRWILR